MNNEFCSISDAEYLIKGRMTTGDQEEVYTLLLTDIDNGVVDDDIVKASLD